MQFAARLIQYVTVKTVSEARYAFEIFCAWTTAASGWQLCRAWGFNKAVTIRLLTLFVLVVLFTAPSIALADFTTPSTEQAQGAQTGMNAIGSSTTTFGVIYAIMFVVSFGLIAKETAGGPDFTKQMIKHFVSLMIIVVLFAGPLTTNVAITDSSPNSTFGSQSQGMPIGMAYAMGVVDTIMGYLSGAISSASINALGVDMSKTPAAWEKQDLQQAAALDNAAVVQKTNAVSAQQYMTDCVSASSLLWAKIKANGIVQHGLGGLVLGGNSVNPYDPAYLNSPASLDCKNQGTTLNNSQDQVNQQLSAAGIDTSKTLPAKFEFALKESFKDAGKALIIWFFTMGTRIAESVYAQALPFFIKIITMMYFAIYPVVVARAMFPGQFGVLITYLEGYAWISLIPIIVAAVDHSHFTGFFGLFNANVNPVVGMMIEIAKFAIVMSVPMLASFLLFGQRMSNTALGGISGAVGAGAMMVAAMAAKGGVGSASKAVQAGKAAKATAAKEANVAASKTLAGQAMSASSISKGEKTGSVNFGSGGGGTSPGGQSGSGSRSGGGNGAGASMGGQSGTGSPFSGATESATAAHEQALNNGAFEQMVADHASGKVDHTGEPPAKAVTSEVTGTAGASGLNMGPDVQNAARSGGAGLTMTNPATGKSVSAVATQGAGKTSMRGGPEMDKIAGKLNNGESVGAVMTGGDGKAIPCNVSKDGSGVSSIKPTPGSTAADSTKMEGMSGKIASGESVDADLKDPKTGNSIPCVAKQGGNGVEFSAKDGASSKDQAAAAGINSRIASGESVDADLKDPKTGNFIPCVAKQGGNGVEFSAKDGASSKDQAAAAGINSRMASGEQFRGSFKAADGSTLFGTASQDGSGTMTFSAQPGASPSEQLSAAGISSRMAGGEQFKGSFKAADGTKASGTVSHNSAPVTYSAPAGSNSDQQTAVAAMVKDMKSNGAVYDAKCTVKGAEAQCAEPMDPMRPDRGAEVTITKISYGMPTSSVPLRGSGAIAEARRLANGGR